MKKIAVLYSGCGHKDGAEISEVVSIFIALSNLNVYFDCFSLNKDVAVFNHLTQSLEINEKRNMLVESARISRGKSKDLKELSVNDYDALVIAGGFGVALNLSNWTTLKTSLEIDEVISRTIVSFFEENKPIGAICIAPILLAGSLKGKNITMTLGPESDDCKRIREMGFEVIECPSDDFITDRDHKILTTPAFMHNTNFGIVFRGISKMCCELVEMA